MWSLSKLWKTTFHQYGWCWSTSFFSISSKIRFLHIFLVKTNVLWPQSRLSCHRRRSRTKVWRHDDNGIRTTPKPPCSSVKTPSSRISKRTLKMSGWAFSTVKEKHWVRFKWTFSVNLPPLVAYIARGSIETASCTSPYTTHIKAIRADSSSKRTSARAFANSVLPDSLSSVLGT